MRAARPNLILAISALALPIACSLATDLDGLSEPANHSGTEAGADAGDEAGADAGDAIEADAQEPDVPSSDVVDATPQPEILIDNISGLSGIALDDEHVYWAESSTPAIRRATKDTQEVERLDDAADQLADPFDVLVDDGFLYWSERTGQEVLRKPVGGGAREHVVWGTGACAFLALHGTELFVTDFREDDPGTGNVVSSPIDGSDGMLIYADQPLAAGIVALAGEIMWARAEPARVVRGTAQGTTPSTVVNASGRVTGLTHDESYLYWLEDGRRIMRADPGSGVPELVHEGTAASDMLDIETDGVYVWWSDRAAGTISRLVVIE